LLSPIQTLVSGFLLLTVLGGVILSLPISTEDGRFQPFLDALFTSASAITTTGLIVVDTGSYYNLFGQIVILFLIQVGGLGYMTLIVFIIILFGQSLSWRGGNLMQESLAVPSRGEMRQFVLRVIQFTLVFELIGAWLLALFWLREYDFGRAVWLGVFHSVSAFCTAGFSLFTEGFNAYRNRWFFNTAVSFISIGGAVGFLVLSEARTVTGKILRGNRVHRLSTHSKLALLVFFGLTVLGTAVIIAAEYTPQTPLSDQFLTASFQAVTASSTTGFNTVPIGEMQSDSLVMITGLMFIGAPTGGTGGGIKATTFGVILLILLAVLCGARDVNAFGRRIGMSTLIKSVAVMIAAVLWLGIVILILTATEDASFLSIVFEAVSALGTVGLSMGMTPGLTAVGKIVIILSMLAGRIGPLAMAFTLVGGGGVKAYRYPEEEVFVG
jgi:trk system potassium uptake protein TrkH